MDSSLLTKTHNFDFYHHDGTTLFLPAILALVVVALLDDIASVVVVLLCLLSFALCVLFCVNTFADDS